jgi:hypothetical protein
LDPRSRSGRRPGLMTARGDCQLFATALCKLSVELGRGDGHRGCSAGDRPGHPRLGDFDHRPPAGLAAPGDDAGLSVRFNDPRQSAGRDLPAATGLFLFHRQAPFGYSSAMSHCTYVGSELEPFAAATRWKAYQRRHFAPYLGSDVLEVGAVIGGTTRILCRGDEPSWLCLEPDPALANRLRRALRDGELPPCCDAVVGLLAEPIVSGPFDTILYIDVLEDDRTELARALSTSGPAGTSSPCRRRIHGCTRRLTGRLATTGATPGQPSRPWTPEDLRLVLMIYLDPVGLLASCGNRLILRNAMATHRQISLWDKVMVPISRFVDPHLGYRLGKSIMGVWRKPSST